MQQWVLVGCAGQPKWAHDGLWEPHPLLDYFSILIVVGHACQPKCAHDGLWEPHPCLITSVHSCWWAQRTVGKQANFTSIINCNVCCIITILSTNDPAALLMHAMSLLTARSGHHIESQHSIDWDVEMTTQDTFLFSASIMQAAREHKAQRATWMSCQTMWKIFVIGRDVNQSKKFPIEMMYWWCEATTI